MSETEVVWWGARKPVESVVRKEAYFLEGQGVYYHVIKSRTTRSMSIFEISIENTGRYTAVGRKFESGSLLPVQDRDQTDSSRP